MLLSRFVQFLKTSPSKLKDFKNLKPQIAPKLSWGWAYNDGLFLLPEPLFAQEDHSSFEDEAHGMKLQALLDLAQKVADVEPLHTTVVEQVAWAQIDRLKQNNFFNFVTKNISLTFKGVNFSLELKKKYFKSPIDLKTAL